MSVTVRPATMDDAEGVIGLGVAMRLESFPFRSLTPDYSKQYSTMEFILESPHHCLFVTDDLTGMFIGHLEVIPWFVEIIAFEDILFVQPEVRKTRRAYLLVQAFLGWAVENNAALVRSTISTGVEVEASVSFYEKLGFISDGISMHRRL